MQDIMHLEKLLRFEISLTENLVKKIEKATWMDAEMICNTKRVIGKTSLTQSHRFNHLRFLYKKQLDLLNLVNPSFAIRYRQEILARISQCPFDDGHPETLKYISECRPCPLAPRSP